MLVLYGQAFAQRSFAIKDVHVPDNVRIEEFRSFGDVYDMPIEKGNHCQTYNLLYPNKYSYGDGIYIYYIRGTFHVPHRIFIVIIQKLISSKMQVSSHPAMWFVNIQNALIN